MRIAHVSCVYPPYKGGIGRVAFEYVERLRARGHDAHAFSLSHAHAGDDPPYVHRLPAWRVGNAGFAPSLRSALDGFELVHLHYPFFGGAEFALLHRRMHPTVPLVVTYHMDAQATDWRRFVFFGYRATLFPLLMRAADRILVSSKDYWAHSQLADVKGIDARVVEMPLGVDLTRFAPGDASERRASLGADAQTPLLLFVGGLDAAHHFKGLEVLFEALRPIMGTPWRLAVVGDGDLRATYEARVEDFGLKQRVHFVGAVSDAVLPGVYQAADLFVFPSTGRAEAFGLVLLEAAASGVPAIASDLPGVRTVVEDGKTGLLVPPRNAEALSQAILRLLWDPAARQAMGEMARARAARQYAWDPLMDRLIDVYRALL